MATRVTHSRARGGLKPAFAAWRLRYAPSLAGHAGPTVPPQLTIPIGPPSGADQSGHPRRLDRKLANRFPTRRTPRRVGGGARAAILRSLLCTPSCGISGEPDTLSKTIRKRILTATSQASKAADYLRSFCQPGVVAQFQKRPGQRRTADFDTGSGDKSLQWLSHQFLHLPAQQAAASDHTLTLGVSGAEQRAALRLIPNPTWNSVPKTG